VVNQPDSSIVNLARLTLPHRTRGDFKDFSEGGWTEALPNWTVQAFDSGALPQFEHPDAFCAAYERFLAAAPARP
jgi:hypothetical protein